MALAPLLASGCATTLPPDILPYLNPVSATTEIYSVRPTSVIRDYRPRQAVDPQPWRQRNDQQVPKVGEGAS